MKDFFTSDWHLSHKKIIELGGRPFSSVEEMDATIIDNMLTKVPRKGNLYFLGDLSFSKETIEKILDLFRWYKVNFYWIVGNHDVKLNPKQYEDKFVKVSDSLIYKNSDVQAHLFHFPLRIWHRSYANTFHLYGHVHKFSIEKEILQDIPYGKSLNVNVEFNDFQPYSLEEIVDTMKNKPNNIDNELMVKNENI